MGKLFGAVKHAAKDFSDDECMVSGAAIAYYTIFALPPLLVIVFFVAGLFGVSHAKINEVVKKQLGLPTTAVAGQQESQGASAQDASRFEKLSDSHSVPSRSLPVDGIGPAAHGVPGAFPLTNIAASIVSADPRPDSEPRPEPPPLPEGPGIGEPPLTSTFTAQQESTLEADAEPQPTNAVEQNAARTVGSDTPPSDESRATASAARPQSSATPPGARARASTSVRDQPRQQPAPTRQSQGTARQSGSANSGEQETGLGGVAGRAQSQPAPLSGLGPISKVIGILVLIFSATGVFAQLQHALNRAWEVEPDPEQGGIWTFLFKRLLSVGMIAVLAFLLLVSLVLTTLIDEIVSLVTGGSTGLFATIVGIALNSLGTLAIGTLLFAAMFKLLPDAKMRWKDTWVGAFMTALLFVIGKALLGWYLQSSNIGSTWGSAAASMIAVLVWVYYTSLIVLFGAELAQVWATRYGHGIEPAKGAVRIVEEKHHVRGSAA